jgi:hypothetical protein
MKRIPAVLLVLVACGGDPCKDAVANMIEASMNDGGEHKAVDSDYMAKAKGAVADVLVDVCHRDKWSAAAMDCLKTANDFMSTHACQQTMTDAQQRAASKAIESALADLPK